jgi:hypothetical protein
MPLTDLEIEVIKEKIITREDVSICINAYCKHSSDGPDFKWFAQWCFDIFRKRR